MAKREIGELTTIESGMWEKIRCDQVGIKRTLQVALTTHANMRAHLEKDLEEFWQQIRERFGEQDGTIELVYEDRSWKVLIQDEPGKDVLADS